MRKIAIIGASYFQVPLIKKAKEMGLETHVFAWAANDVGEKLADYFYPISIVEREEILQKCRELKVDGICSIASDLAMLTVNYVATQMGLTGNDMVTTENSTNKYKMRQCFEINGDPIPGFKKIGPEEEISDIPFSFPIIIKPTDRSGSRGITKLYSKEKLKDAIRAAREVSLNGEVLIEEFAEGDEYSVECISWKGKHHFLAITQKYTSGSPHFVETGHMEPADLSSALEDIVKEITFHALDSLGIRFGASHAELKIAKDNSIRIIEIGGRMGGDFIGSSLVHLSTGIDFVKAVIQIAMGEEPDLLPEKEQASAAVRFIFDERDKEVFEKLVKNHPEYIVEVEIKEILDKEILESGDRFGYFLMCDTDRNKLLPYMPE